MKEGGSLCRLWRTVRGADIPVCPAGTPAERISHESALFAEYMRDRGDHDCPRRSVGVQASTALVREIRRGILVESDPGAWLPEKSGQIEDEYQNAEERERRANEVKDPLACRVPVFWCAHGVSVGVFMD